MAVIPRSDRAKLIDFVKFNGTIDGSRRSMVVSTSTLRDFEQLGELDTGSELVNLDIMTPLSGI